MVEFLGPGQDCWLPSVHAHCPYRCCGRRTMPSLSWILDLTLSMVSELSTWQSLQANQSDVGVSTCDKSANLEGDGLAREGLDEAVGWGSLYQHAVLLPVALRFALLKKAKVS